MRKNLHAGATFIDVGANFGYYTALASTIVGVKGRAIALEPSLKTVHYLLKNVEKYENVDIVPVAAGSGNTVEKFYQTQDYASSGMAPNPFDSTGGIISSTVISLTLDTILSEIYGLSSVDFIKTDVQGDDVEVLRGAGQILERSASVKVLVEWAPAWMSHAGFDPAVLPRTLESLGFNNIMCADDWTGSFMQIDGFLVEVERDTSGKRFCNIFAQRS